MKWVTRERPKIDRLACPWPIKSFINIDTEFLYAPKDQVLNAVEEQDAIPFDVSDVELAHSGDLCSFDAFQLSEPPLQHLAKIVRGAGTDSHELAPECAGLLAISLWLGHNFTNDHDLLNRALILFDGPNIIPTRLITGGQHQVRIAKS